jgi:hypothetical protein
MQEECNFHTHSDFDTLECDNDTHDCNFITHKSDFYTQRGILHAVWFLHTRE